MAQGILQNSLKDGIAFFWATVANIKIPLKLSSHDFTDPNSVPMAARSCDPVY